jgi:hypothetical protein
MLEMYKYILSKVSFDREIFRKELNKALNSLNREEAIQLFRWCRISFDARLMEHVSAKKDDVSGK